MSADQEQSHKTNGEGATPALITFHEIAETQHPERSTTDNATALLQFALAKHAEISGDLPPKSTARLGDIVRFAQFLKTAPTEEDLVHIEMLEEVVRQISNARSTPLPIAERISKIA